MISSKQNIVLNLGRRKMPSIDIEMCLTSCVTPYFGQKRGSACMLRFNLF